MKKFFLAIMVAAATMINFTSCKDDTDDMSNDDLAKNIVNYGSYSDEEVDDLDEVTFTTSLATYNYDGELMIKGAWRVEGGMVIITSDGTGLIAAGEEIVLTIAKEGKELTTTAGDVLKKK